jgi:hypothetical protein
VRPWPSHVHIVVLHPGEVKKDFRDSRKHQGKPSLLDKAEQLQHGVRCGGRVAAVTPDEIETEHLAESQESRVGGQSTASCGNSVQYPEARGIGTGRKSVLKYREGMDLLLITSEARRQFHTNLRGEIANAPDCPGDARTQKHQ